MRTSCLVKDLALGLRKAPYLLLFYSAIPTMRLLCLRVMACRIYSSITSCQNFDQQLGDHWSPQAQTLQGTYRLS